MKRFLILLLFATPLWAQQPSTRVAADLTVGTASGLGYRLPYSAFGADVERVLGDRLEARIAADYSFTTKYGETSGSQEHLSGRLLAWVKPNFGFTAEDGEAFLHTSLFTKSSNSPLVGIVNRCWAFGVPTRIYLGYIVPTGSRPTDGSLQSNRLQGGRFIYEGQFTSRLRLIFLFDIVTLLDQSGDASGHREWSGTALVTFRIGTKQNAYELY